jgi:AcrR family transcriptional regulator
MPRNPTATRARIYAAAYALFYRKGFQRTSLDDIAAKAGVTKRTLYYHVRSKDDLAGAMLAHQHGFVLAEMARWMGSATSVPKMVDQLFDSVARNAADVAAQLQMLLEGAMILMLIHGDARYAKLAARAARRLV